MSPREHFKSRIRGSLRDRPEPFGRTSPAPTGDHDLNPADRRARDGRTLRSAAVLVPLIDRADEITVLLTQRTEHLSDHAGQVSFPGGRVEPDDAHVIDTALRETEEEVGLARRFVDIVGYLDAYETGTGYHVTPVVGFVRPGFAVTPDSFEVAEVFEVPLSFIFDPGNHQRHSREYRGRRRHFFAMPYGEYYIWGATAGMLMNLYRRVHGLL